MTCSDKTPRSGVFSASAPTSATLPSPCPDGLIATTPACPQCPSLWLADRSTPTARRLPLTAAQVTSKGPSCFPPASTAALPPTSAATLLPCHTLPPPGGNSTLQAAGSSSRNLLPPLRRVTPGCIQADFTHPLQANLANGTECPRHYQRTDNHPGGRYFERLGEQA